MKVAVLNGSSESLPLNEIENPEDEVFKKPVSPSSVHEEQQKGEAENVGRIKEFQAEGIDNNEAQLKSEAEILAMIEEFQIKAKSNYDEFQVKSNNDYVNLRDNVINMLRKLKERVAYSF